MYFLPKTFIKHCRNRDKPIYRLKKLKKIPQKPKSTRAQICFFTNFKNKNKKTSNMNSLIKWNHLTQILSVLVT
jgi:hypothetical protein